MNGLAKGADMEQDTGTRSGGRTFTKSVYGDTDSAIEMGASRLGPFMSGTEWIEGVTPTWTGCPHGVVIARGTYLRALEPTGDHPDCLAALAAHEERAAEEYYAEAVGAMYS